MPWTCQCTALNYDSDDTCIRCGRPLKEPSYKATAWKLAAVGFALLIGVSVGLTLAVSGNKSSRDTTVTTAQASRNTEDMSANQQSYDAAFRNSCRISAMSSSGVSRAVADNYCDCALESIHKNRSMSQAVADCKKYVFR